MSDQLPKKRIQVKQHIDPATGILKRDIFIDDELFPWEVDLNSLEYARGLGGKYYVAAQQDIQKHFLDSLSDFLGRAVDEEAFFKAVKEGMI